MRTLAQEYGGGAFTVSGDVVFFANYKDQRLYKQSISSLGKQASVFTPQYPYFCAPLICACLDSRRVKLNYGGTGTQTILAKTTNKITAPP